MYRRLQFLVAILAFFTSSVAKVIHVHVNAHRFGPSAFKAKIGDQIIFQFKEGNATFTESTFDRPCKPRKGGLDSGFINVPSHPHHHLHHLHQHHKHPNLTFSFTIQSFKAIYFFNRQTHPKNACKAGFVGSINASSRRPASHFRANAENFQLDSGKSTTHTPSPTTSNVGTTQTSQTQSPGTGSNSSKNNSNVVIAVVGIFLGVMTLTTTVAVFFAVRRWRRRRRIALFNDLPVEYRGTESTQLNWPGRLLASIKTRISPFVAENAGRNDYAAQKAQAQGFQESALVPYGLPQAEMHQSNSARVITLPDSERDVTDGYGDEFEITSYPFVLGEERTWLESDAGDINRVQTQNVSMKGGKSTSGRDSRRT